MKNKNIEYLFNIISTIFISILIYYIFHNVGLYLFFIATPFIVIYKNYGIKELLITAVIFSVISLLFANILNIFIILLFIILFSTLTIYLAHKKFSTAKIILYMAIFTFIYGILIYSAINLYLYNGIYNDIKIHLESSRLALEESIKNDINYMSSGLMNKPNMIRDIFNYILQVLPSLWMITAILVSGINVLLSLFLINKTNKLEKYDIKINNIRFSKEFRIFLTLTTIVLAIIYFLDLEFLSYLFNNLSLLVAVLLYFNGILAFDYIMSKRMNIIFRLILIIMLTILFTGIFFVTFGVLDLFFNFKDKARYVKEKIK